MAEIGFFGLTIPEEYGGLGGDYVTYALGMEELGRADSALRGIVSVSNGLVGKSILGFGTEEQKQEWLPGIATAEQLGCFGLTEPGTGSDAGNLTTRATRDGSDYVLNGQKLFITNGTWAHVALVFARTSDDGPRGVTAFLVPTDTAGFEAREIKGKLGLRGQATAELFLEDVRVPASARLGEEGQGFKIAMSIARQGPGLRRRRLRRAGPGLPRVLGRVRHRAHPVRPADRRLPAGAGHDRRHLPRRRRGAAAGLAGRRPDIDRGAATSGSRPPRPSSSPPRLRSAPPTTASRSTAAPGTSTSTPPRSTSATPG